MKDTSGPAFPSRLENRSDKPMDSFDGSKVPAGKFVAYAGMSLRDYFAAKAMPFAMSVLHGNEGSELGELCWESEINGGPHSDLKLVAEKAYLMADAMLAERVK